MAEGVELEFHVTSLDAFLGNSKETIRTLEGILDDPTRHTAALVFGGSGTGKSTLCDLLAAKYEDAYDILMVKRHGVDTDRGIKALVDNFLRSKTIESFFSNKHSKLVILDDIDIHMSTERGYLLYLQSLMASIESIGAHVIMTCCAAEEKKTTDLKRKVPHVLRLVPPTPEEAYAAFRPIFERAFPGTHDLSAKLRSLIDVAGGNVRYIVTNAHVLLRKDGGDAAMSVERAHRSFLHCSTIESACKLLQGTASGRVRDLDALSDPMVSHVMYENYVHEVCANRANRANRAAATQQLGSIACGVMDTWILSDILETHIFRTSDWGLYGYLTPLRVGCITEVLAGIKRPARSKKAAAAYTPVLSKLALRSTFGKKMATLKEACALYDDEAMFTLMDRVFYTCDLTAVLKDAAAASANAMLKQVILPYMEYMHEVDKKAVAKLRRRRAAQGAPKCSSDQEGGL
jgi:hypothetical protein